MVTFDDAAVTVFEQRCAECPSCEVDLVLALDQSGSLAGGTDRVVETAVEIIKQLDLSTTRIAVVGFDETVTVEFDFLSFRQTAGVSGAAEQGGAAGDAATADRGCADLDDVSFR